MHEQILAFAIPGYHIEVFQFSHLSRPFRPHFHPGITLGCLLAGEREFATPAGRVIIKPFKLVALPPGVPHACKQLSGRDSEWVGAQIEIGAIMGGLTVCESPKTEVLREKLLETLLEIRETAKPCPTLLEKLCVDSQCLLMSKSTGSQQTAGEFHYPELRLSLAEMACSAGMDKFRYLREFRLEHGITPVRHAANARLNRACQQLRSGKKAVDCAHSCGYCDQAHFSRHFKAHLGITPAKYRQAWQKCEF